MILPKLALVRLRAAILGAALALGSVGLGGIVGNGVGVLGCMPAADGTALVAHTHVDESGPSSGNEAIEDGDHGDATEPISRLTRARWSGSNDDAPIAFLSSLAVAEGWEAPAAERNALERPQRPVRRVAEEILLCVGRTGVDPPCVRS
jgi:hypothetical protein